MTDYSGFYIYKDGRNSFKNNIHSHNKEGLYKAMWDEFCEGTPDKYATQKWENVLNGRHDSGKITVENGIMTFNFDPDGFRKLNEFKRIVSEILTNGIKPGSKSKSKSKSKRGGKKRGKKSRRNTSRVR